MSKLGTMVATELQSLDWERLTPKDSPVKIDDTRKWMIYAMSKAIWQFAYDKVTLTILANGTFVNNSNFIIPGTPAPVPTIGVTLTGWLALPSQKKLYDLLLPWTTGNDDPSTAMVDTFQRIFVKWLGVLEIIAGQDGEVALPLIAPPAPNVAPPFFHSVNGCTLTANRFVPPRDLVNPSPYPVLSPVQPQAGMASPAPDTGIQGAIDTEVARWVTLKATATTQETTALASWTGSTLVADLEVLRQPWRNQWQVALEALRTEQKTLRGSKTPDTARLTQIDTDIKTTQDACIDKTDADYPACTARVEMCEYERALAEEGGGAIPAPTPPTPVDSGSTNPDAPAIGQAQTIEPVIPEYEFPATPAWYMTRPALTFPNFATHGKACYDELNSSAPENLEDAWQIIGKHLGLCFNDNVPTMGGGSGYGYGLPVNPWQGTILVTALWSDV